MTHVVDASPAKPGLKGDFLVADQQLVSCFQSDVQNNLSVLDEFAGDPRRGIDRYSQIWRKTLISAPFVDCADQVGFG